jgi:hypothetical protein
LEISGMSTASVRVCTGFRAAACEVVIELWVP